MKFKNSLHPLFSGSALMFIGVNLANFIAYLYHLIFGRILGPSSYGELATVISVIAIGTSAFSFLGLVTVKFTASASKDELTGVFYILKKFSVWVFAGLLLFGLFAKPLSDFLRVDVLLLVLIFPIFFFSYLHL